MPSSPTPPAPANTTPVPPKTPSFTFNTGNVSELTRLQRNVTTTLDAVLSFLNGVFGVPSPTKTLGLTAQKAGSTQIASPSSNTLVLLGNLQTPGTVSSSVGDRILAGPFTVSGSLAANTTTNLVVPGTNTAQIYVPLAACSLIGMSWAISNMTSTGTSILLAVNQVYRPSTFFNVSGAGTYYGSVAFARGAYPIAAMQQNLFCTYNMTNAVSSMVIQLWLTLALNV